MAGDGELVSPRKGSANGVNRGGRPRKYSPEEAKQRRAAARKQSHNSKPSRHAPGTYQFIHYCPPEAESGLNRPIPIVKNEQELDGATLDIASVPPRLHSADTITTPDHPAWEDSGPIMTTASGKQQTGPSDPSADIPLDLDNITLEAAAILSKLRINTPVPMRNGNADTQLVSDGPTTLGLRSGLTPDIDNGQAGQAGRSRLHSIDHATLLGDHPRHSDKSDKEPDEFTTASDTQEHSLWCDDDSSGSANGRVVPSPPSISFGFERELRTEAMMIESDSLSSISSQASYFAESQSDADGEEEGEKVLTDRNIPDEAISSDAVRDDIALHLATQLYAFQGCTQEQHEEQDCQHQLHHQQTGSNLQCASLADILPIIQGRGVDGALTPLPNVLSQQGIMKALELPQDSCCSAFEGIAQMPPDRPGERGDFTTSQSPRSLCFSANYSQSQPGPGPEVTYDIDSICGEVDSLAFARLGLQ